MNLLYESESSLWIEKVERAVSLPTGWRKTLQKKNVNLHSSIGTLIVTLFCWIFEHKSAGEESSATLSAEI